MLISFLVAIILLLILNHILLFIPLSLSVNNTLLINLFFIVSMIQIFIFKQLSLWWLKENKLHYLNRYVQRDDIRDEFKTISTSVDKHLSQIEIQAVEHQMRTTLKKKLEEEINKLARHSFTLGYWLIFISYLAVIIYLLLFSPIEKTD